MLQSKISRGKHQAAMAGFTLVELMVGITIGLIGMLIITQVLVVSNAQKNTTVSGADAQTTGTLGMYTIERDARMAGYGLNYPELLGCTLHAYDEGVSPVRDDFTFTLAPVVITAGVGNAPDTISISYSGSDSRMVPAKLTQANSGNNANYKVDNRFGFHEGDLIILAESGVADCTLGQVTGVPGGGQSDNIIHNSGNYTTPQGDTVPARYNKPSGLGYPYTTSGKIFNLGQTPVNNTYSIQNNELMLLSNLGSPTPMSIGENIVQLKARYGKDTDNDGQVDTYDSVTPANATQWAQVLTLRFALLARSKQPEQTAVSPASLPPLWTGGPVITLTDAERRYRYKTFQTVVPLRNMIWKIS